jgi:hypothetical protein
MRETLKDVELVVERFLAYKRALGRKYLSARRPSCRC